MAVELTGETGEMTRNRKNRRLGIAVLGLSGVCLVGTGLAPSTAVSPSAAQQVVPWRWPVSTPLPTNTFAAPEQPWLAGHRGVDIAASPGETVVAATAGVVTFVGRVVDRDVITVSHGHWRSTVEPVTATVVVGQSVSAGQQLGTLSTGGHCVGCVHWGVRLKDDYVDPVLLVQGYDPVLKPTLPW